MLRSRIIPILLVRNNGLVKTLNFSNDVYVGDPLNAVRIFNEKKSDELVILDIDASTKKSEPNFSLISNWAAECRMPLCYGGGITNKDDALKILSLGVEKISISSSAIKKPVLIDEIASLAGSQSVVVTIDVKKKFLKGYKIFTSNGTIQHDIDLLDYLKIAQDYGAGEIVINNIDRDGTMIGPDYNLIDKVYNQVKIPLVVMGGFGTIDEISLLFNKYSQIGAACGSLFVFKGKNRAVLINYPRKEILGKIQQI